MLAFMVIVPLRFMHPSKQFRISVTLEGITGAFVIQVQPWKQAFMYVTLSGIVIPDKSVRLVHPAKQLVMVVRLVQADKSGASVRLVHP